MNEMETRSFKARWAWFGAIVGAIIVLEDMLLEWRGQLYDPWISPSAIAGNIVQMMTVIGIPALIGLGLGAIRDRRK
jgi:hypothetical protein